MAINCATSECLGLIRKVGKNLRSSDKLCWRPKNKKKKESSLAKLKALHTPEKNSKLENVAIANALQLEAARATPAFPDLITTPYQVWSHWTYPLLYYSIFAADTLLCAVNLTFDSVTLTFDLRPWTFAVYRLWRDDTLYQIRTHSNNPQRSYCDFRVWPYDLEHCVTCCAGIWDIFTQFDFRQLIVLE